MLVGIMGRQGSGKTLLMSLLVQIIHQKTGLPIFANYKSLRNANYINKISQIWGLNSAIFCFDEIWLTLDSRSFRDNLELTRWINQVRKKGIITFYTTQHINQVDLRVRNATDILIYCEKNPKNSNERIYTFVDYQYKQIGKKCSLNQIEKLFYLYNSYETLEPITAK
jgi:type IV secretory pathway VirB4 component